MTDTIADMLTRIRNALIAKHDSVEIPASTMKKAIAQILVDEGYVKSFEVIADGEKKTIRIQLKYGANKQRVIVGIKRISRPGLRVYARKDEMPKVLGGLGIAIVSTSRGVMTDREARIRALAAKYWPTFGNQKRADASFFGEIAARRSTGKQTSAPA